MKSIVAYMMKYTQPNTSFLRLDDTSNVNFVLSDALFFEEKDLQHHSTIDGLSRQQSNNRRLEKYKLINNLRSKRLIITDSGMNINFKSRLEKNIKSDVIEILDSKKIWSLYLSIFNCKNFVSIFLHLNVYLKIKFIIQLVMRLE